MAGNVHALLLKSAARSPAPNDPPVVPLTPGSGLALLPLTDDVIAGLQSTETDRDPVTGFYELTSGIAAWASRQSRHGDVAYLHSEFFGGGGFHAAIAWRDGEIAWGPLFTATSAGEAEDHYTVVTDLHDMAGNVLLRWLGVRKTGQIDEFTAAGLGRHRWTEEWAGASRP